MGDSQPEAEALPKSSILNSLRQTAIDLGEIVKRVIKPSPQQTFIDSIQGSAKNGRDFYQERWDELTREEYTENLLVISSYLTGIISSILFVALVGGGDTLVNNAGSISDMLGGISPSEIINTETIKLFLELLGKNLENLRIAIEKFGNIGKFLDSKPIFKIVLPIIFRVLSVFMRRLARTRIEEIKKEKFSLIQDALSAKQPQFEKGKVKEKLKLILNI